jgi:hypothetical protein
MRAMIFNDWCNLIPRIRQVGLATRVRHWAWTRARVAENKIVRGELLDFQL